MALEIIIHIRLQLDLIATTNTYSRRSNLIYKHVEGRVKVNCGHRDNFFKFDTANAISVLGSSST